MAKPTKKKSTKKKTTKRGKYIRFIDKTRGIIKTLSRKGFTDAEMSGIIGITETTFNNWKKRYPDFFKSLNEWKQWPDSEVERSLFERACGYEHPETKAQFVQDIHGGKWETLDMVKHYPPDPTSMIFWLKNRQPDKWRDKKEHGFTGKDGEDLKWQVEVVEAETKDGEYCGKSQKYIRL